MKKLLILLLCAGVASAADMGLLSGLNVCVINSIDVVRESAAGKKMVADFEQLRTTYARDIEKTQQEFIKAVESFQQNANTMSAKALEKAQEHITFLQKTLEAKVEEVNKKIAKAAKIAQDAFDASARAGINASVKNHDIDLLIDIARDPIMFASDRAQQLLVELQDITQEVIDVVDSK